MSNSLDPDQARRFVGPDLGSNCLPRLSEDDTDRQRVNKPQQLQVRPVTWSILCQDVSLVANFTLISRSAFYRTIKRVIKILAQDVYLVNNQR